MRTGGDEMMAMKGARMAATYPSMATNYVWEMTMATNRRELVVEIVENQVRCFVGFLVMAEEA